MSLSLAEHTIGFGTAACAAVLLNMSTHAQAPAALFSWLHPSDAVPGSYDWHSASLSRSISASERTSM